MVNVSNNGVSRQLCGLVASLGLGADTPPSAANPTAEQVIEKNLAARGGLQAWRAVQTLSMGGKYPVQIYY